LWGLWERGTRAASLCFCAYIVGLNRLSNRAERHRLRALLLAGCFLGSCLSVPAALAQSQGQDDEIVTSLSGGRVILHFAKEAIFFAAGDEPVEEGAPPPRVLDLYGQHIAILLGASEWRSLADPKPIRLDRNIQKVSGPDPHAGGYEDVADPDLEILGTEFLEKLRPMVSQLRRKIDFPADQPFFEMVVIGYGPKNYGAEAWTVEYRISQQLLTTRDNFWQTR